MSSFTINKNGHYLSNILFVSVFLIAFSSCSPEQQYIHPEPATIDTNVVIPPAWTFGVLYGGYTNQEQSINRIKKIQEHDYPIDAYWIDSWFWSFDDGGRGPDKYIDFVADTTAYPDREAMWDFMEQNNIKGGFWVWDAIQKTGNEEAFKDFKERGYFRNVYMNTNPWHNNGTRMARFQEGDDEEEDEGTPTGNIDFKNPDAVNYFKQRMKHFFDEGADFIKLDRTDAIHVCEVMFEMSQDFGSETEGRGFILSHSGGTDRPEFKKYPAKWTDDTRSDWTVESPTKEFSSWVPNVAFKENIAMYTDPEKSTSTIPFLTNDTGGFDMGKTDEVDEELYNRWVQFSMFGQITSVFSQPENPTSNMAYNYSERADTLFRHYAHLRMKLFPYLYTYAHNTRLKSEPMIRKFPEHIYQYKLGEEFLVAPVYKQGATTREVHFPEGAWINYWTGEKIDGGQTLTMDAPINRIPVFVKAGAVIPMRDYASSIEAGSNGRITLDIYPGSDAAFTMIEDDGSSNDYLEGLYAKTEIEFAKDGDTDRLTIHPTKGHYEGIPERRKWSVQIHTDRPVTGILKDGEQLTFTQENGKVVTADFSAGRYTKQVLRIRYGK